MGVNGSGCDNDRAAIRNLARDWNHGWNRSAAEALLALYTDDPVLMPQGIPAVTAKNAIRLLYQSLFRDHRG